MDREKQDGYRVLAFEDTAGSVALIVNVHVGDVNDNRPAFDQGQYQITLGDDVTPGQVVLQVNATDADLNDNSRLTYRILTCGQWFSIDGTSGKVKVITSPPSDVTECSLEVSDAGTPPLQSHTSVMIYFPLFNETAMVILPTASGELMADREGVARKLSGILGVNVHIHSIDSLGDVASLGSKVYISATTADGHKVYPTDLNSLLKAHAPAIYSAFQKSTKSEDSEKLFTVPFSVVLALAILLLLICLLFAVLLYRQRQKYKINLRLFEKLHQDTKIYDATRSLSVTQIPEVRNGDVSRSSRSNGSARSSRGETEVIPYFSSLDQGYVNSTFVDDDMTYSNIQDQSNVRRGSRDTYDVADVPVPDSRQGEVTERASLTTEVTKITEPAHVTVIAVRRLSHGEQDRESLGFEDESPPLDSQRHASLARRPSEADSGVPAESHHDDDNEDDDDKEVADIYANVNKNNTAEKQLHTGPNLDLMTFAQTSAPTTSAHTYTPHDPYEPEPDYAKRVHFNEEASAYGERPEEEIDQPSTEFVDSPSHHGDLANEMFEITAL
ncbi:uncharacterized protein LOC131949036 [Physella acuta]|uniref:uncharacterized protein LOC131949036 n=1 Tax=Physella acuta TaxID=109671 RepID=UPI0027DCC06A|nr:uncharacterized protein LOC131949036 [Physella acuta]